MGFICLGPLQIAVSKDNVVVISGSVQAAGTLTAKVSGPGVAYSASANGVGPEVLPAQAFVVTSGGVLSVEFPGDFAMEVIASEAVCEFGDQRFVETYVFATDAHDTPSPDNDFNDLVLTVQVIKRRG